MKHNNNKKGFTFVELLISISIFSLIAIALYSSFYVGIRAWHKEQTLNKKAFAYQRALFDLESRIQNAQKTLFMKFAGTADELYFSALLPHYSTEAETIQVLTKVHFYLDESSSHSDYILEKKELPLTLETDPGKTEPVTIINNVKKLSFLYPYTVTANEETEQEEDSDTDLEIIWKPTWQDPEIIPCAVQVSLELDDDTQTVLKRTIILPQGELTQYQEEEEEEE